MYILWKKGIVRKRASEILNERVGWSKTTTYNVIKKCFKRKLIKRIEPNLLVPCCFEYEKVTKL